jgi:hypothetical protein
LEFWGKGKEGEGACAGNLSLIVDQNKTKTPHTINCQSARRII